MPDPFVLIISDTHIGGFTALAPAEFKTESGQIVKFDWRQEWLHDCFCADVAQIKKRLRGRRLVVVHAGDVVDGRHHENIDALPDLQDQEAMAVQILTPLRNMADKFFICKGTEVHSGPLAQSERRIAKELAAKIGYRFSLDTGYGILDVAHHPGGGLLKIKNDILENCTALGTPLPRFVVRGHAHTIDDSGEKWSNIRVVLAPCWQFKTGHGWRVAPNKRANVGMITIDEGRLEIIRHEPKADKVIKV